MSDGSIKPFPMSSAESFVVVEPALHCMLKHLRHLMLHPLLSREFPIFENEVFSGTLNIGRLTPQFLQVR